MPNKLTDAEVKKALEEYVAYAGDQYIHYSTVKVDILKNALDLINRQQAELDKYEQIKITINEFWDILLKFSIIKRKEKPTLEEFAEAIQEIKAEAYKECIEKVMETALVIKENAFQGCYVISKGNLDNLFKELVG